MDARRDKETDAISTANAGEAPMSRALRLIAIVGLEVGLLMRLLPLLAAPTAPLQTCDGRAYYLMAVSWASGRGFHLDDPYLRSVCSHLGIGPSHHYAPALPMIEGTFVSIFGDSPFALAAPLLLLSWGAVAVAWWTTRDLYGSGAALLVAAALSLEWTGFFFGTWLGYSENLVVIALTLTVWAVLKGLRDDRFMLLAGLAAGLGYLSKAGVGWFFLLAGFGGLAWRVLFRGWRVLGNRWYWAAIALFAVPFLAWAYRNVSLFWDGTPTGLLEAWQTSGPTARLVAAAIAQPVELAIGLAGKLPMLLVFLALPFVPLAPALRRALRNWRDEQALGLWMTVGLIFLLGWFFAAAFWVSERTSLLWADPIRYVAPAQVPLLWLIVRERQAFNTRAWALSLVILGLLLVAMPLLLAPGRLFDQW